MDRNTAAHLHTAWAAIRNRDLMSAEKIAADLLNASSGDAGALYLAGTICSLRQQPRHAIDYFKRAVAVAPQEPLIHIALGRSLREIDDEAGAISALRRATEIAPTLAGAWFEFGKALKGDNRIDDARDALEKALSLDPSLVAARGSLGDVYRSIGDVERASANYRACLSDTTQAPRAWHRLANLKTVRLTIDDAEKLQSLYDSTTLTDADRIPVGYALVKALEDQKRFEDAFDRLNAVSRLQRARVKWDAAAFSETVTRIQSAFADGEPAETNFGGEAIFIVSMPRSGSTLLEQMLGSHSSIAQAGERSDIETVLGEESRRRDAPFPRWVAATTPEDWHRMGTDYLQRTARFRQDKPRFTDKGLNNWLYVGAIARMLPGARFVDCRRDALETCLSCYRQLFSFGNDFSYDIDELAAYRHDYDRLSRFWHRRHPDRVFALSYEGLIQSPEAQMRELLDFLGRPFENEVLEFHASARPVHTFSAAQVRQPLQKDTARAACYGRALDPLRAALAREISNRFDM